MTTLRMTWPMYQNCRVSVDGRSIGLSQLETEFLSVLLMRRGEPISMNEMVDIIYRDPDAGPEYEHDVLRTILLRLRKKIGWGVIQNWHGMGYWIARA